jgi:hypothetical protein
MDQRSGQKRAVEYLYPPIEPFDQRMIDMGDGHRVYVEQCGRPNGQPVFVFHGGPGGGCSPAMRRYFDPRHYRIILFDQRGCGRSRSPCQRYRQYHLAPGAGHRDDPHRPWHRPLHRLWRQLGRDARADLRPDPPRPRGPSGVARRLPDDPRRASVVLRRRGRGLLPRPLVPLRRGDPPRGTRRPHRRLSPPPVLRQPGRGNPLRPDLGQLGKRPRLDPERRRPGRKPLGLCPRLRPAGEPLFPERGLS